jgi:hypothetical protein
MKLGSRKVDFKLADLHKVKLIGKGQSGAVWQATLQQSGTLLAVKQMTLSSDKVRRKMAVRELVTMYGLDHVGIVGCHNVFYSNNAFHLVMELMDGGSLLDAMKRCYTLNAAHMMPPAALATIAVDVLGALEFLRYAVGNEVAEGLGFRENHGYDRVRVDRLACGFAGALPATQPWLEQLRLLPSVGAVHCGEEFAALDQQWDQWLAPWLRTPPAPKRQSSLPGLVRSRLTP